MGENWEFKIESQKRTKGAKHGSHCWKTDNFSSMQKETEVPASSDDEEGEDAEVSYPIKRSKRMCTNCKHSIKGPQWSYLVCKGKDCTNGMTHFECIGFPNVPLELNHLMKTEYECPGCYAKRVVALDEVGFCNIIVGITVWFLYRKLISSMLQPRRKPRKGN